MNFCEIVLIHWVKKEQFWNCSSTDTKEYMAGVEINKQGSTYSCIQLPLPSTHYSLLTSHYIQMSIFFPHSLFCASDSVINQLSVIYFWNSHWDVECSVSSTALRNVYCFFKRSEFCSVLQFLVCLDSGVCLWEDILQSDLWSLTAQVCLLALRFPQILEVLVHWYIW